MVSIVSGVQNKRKWLKTGNTYTSPLLRVISKVLDGTLDGSLALGVDTGANLAENTLLVVVLEPLRGNGETLGANGAADAGLVGAGAVRVEVLVHLVEEKLASRVGRVREVLEGVAGAALDPVPRARVRVALDEDVLLRGARRADVGDGGLV